MNYILNDDGYFLNQSAYDYVVANWSSYEDEFWGETDEYGNVYIYWFPYLPDEILEALSGSGSGGGEIIINPSHHGDPM